ncbi:MAG: SulP family inorganic anion transporter [Aquificota bacterium]|nr:MAG: SulP family inorganic anion transporter [Aquificota bacterium]
MIYSMLTFLPFLGWFKNYTKRDFVADLIAGLTVAVVLVPQSMAYALIAGLPPVYGLYAAAIPPIIAALFGSSYHLATGPVAIVAFLTFTSLVSYAKPGEPKFIELAILMAFLVGLFQFSIGFFRLGFIINFVSHAVILGFANAAAIIISTTQVPALLGIKVEQKELIFQNIYEILRNIHNTNPYTLAIGLVSIALIVGLKRVHPYFPSALFTVVLFTGLSYLFSFEAYGVKVVGEIPRGLPLPQFPSVDWDLFDRIVGKAVVVGVVGYMEAYAIAKLIASQSKQKIDTNQELIGQGLSNIIGSFFKSFPVSGSFSRSAVNFKAGAKTGLSNVISALFVIATLFIFAPLLYYLPRAVLSAIVISAVVGLIDPKKFLHTWKTNRYDGITALSTFALSFIMKPDYAIFIGIFISLSLFLWRSLHPRMVRLARDPATRTFVNAQTYNIPTCPQMEVVRPEASIYYANVENIVESLQDVMEEKKALKHLIIDCESVNYMDGTAVEVLEGFIQESRKKGVNIAFVNLKAPVYETMKSSGLADLIGSENILPSKGYAVGVLFRRIDHDYCKRECPYALFDECYTVKDYIKIQKADHIDLRVLYELLSEREDLDVYAGKRYSRLIVKGPNSEIELKGEDFYADELGRYYLSNSKLVKIGDALVPLGQACKECELLNGYVLLGKELREVAQNIAKIVR